MGYVGYYLVFRSIPWTCIHTHGIWVSGFYRSLQHQPFQEGGWRKKEPTVAFKQYRTHQSDMLMWIQSVWNSSVREDYFRIFCPPSFDENLALVWLDRFLNKKSKTRFPNVRAALTTASCTGKSFATVYRALCIGRYLPCWLPSACWQIRWHSPLAVANVFLWLFHWTRYP